MTKTRRKRKEVQVSGKLAHRLDAPLSEVTASVEIVSDVRDTMNGTERRYYDEYIAPRVDSGELFGYLYDEVTFRLGYRQTYTPDFVVLSSDGAMSVVEVKGGYIYPDALEKIKVFPRLYPFLPFYVAQWKGKEWSIKRIPNR